MSSEIMDNLAQELKIAISEGKEFRMPVKGTSMLPYIHDGDHVTMVASGSIKKNDMIFYQRENGQYVLHRVHHIKDGKYALVGDHQTFIEYPILKEQVIAKVKAIHHKGKTKYPKGFHYSLYIWFFRSMFLRKCYFKIYSWVHH